VAAGGSPAFPPTAAPVRARFRARAGAANLTSMSRLRKASRVWRTPDALAAAARVLLTQDAPAFNVDPAAIFARPAPLEIELGAGKGEFIIEYAAAHPEHNFLAVELSGTVSQLLAVRCGRAELANLRVARMDARTLVNLMLPDRCVAAYHIYFPDPWPKERHLKHRLVNPFFVRNLARTLEPAGTVCVASDVSRWASEIFVMLEAGGFKRVGAETPGSSRTGFARRYQQEGKPVFSGTFVMVSPPMGCTMN
jgi:tRNA (guanine-N7-)-methyltransferase